MMKHAKAKKKEQGHIDPIFLFFVLLFGSAIAVTLIFMLGSALGMWLADFSGVSK